MKWDLALQAEDGTYIEDSELFWHMNSTDEFPGIPVIKITYAVEEDEVDVYAARTDPN